jgi:RNA polymerase sigma factor (sigma-70 family)
MSQLGQPTTRFTGPPDEEPGRPADGTDEALMDRVALRGDSGTLGELESRWHGRLHAFCRRRLRGRHELAEEAAQESWLRAWRYRASWRSDQPDRNFGAWLLTIAKSVCSNVRRTERRWHGWIKWLRELFRRPSAGDPLLHWPPADVLVPPLIAVYHKRSDGQPRPEKQRQNIRLRFWADYHPDKSLRLTEQDLQPLDPNSVLADDEHRRELNALFDSPPPHAGPSAPTAEYLLHRLIGPSLLLKQVADLMGVDVATVSRHCKQYVEDVAATFRHGDDLP